MKSSLTTKALVATAMGAALVAATNGSAVAKPEKEKCYGVAKAGKNDCANLAGTHSCAGQAKADSDPGEWVLVPKGLCAKLVGGMSAEEAKAKSGS